MRAEPLRLPGELEGADDDSSAHGLGGLVVGSTLLLASAALVSRRAVPRHGGRQRCPRAALVKTQESGGQGADEEVVELENQAAKLRASAAILEAEMVQQKQYEEQKLFKTFDADGSGGVDVEELQRGWREFTGTDLDMEMAAQLLEEYDNNNNGVLEIEEFDARGMKVTLEKLQAQAEATKVKALMAEQARLATLKAEEELKEYYEHLPGPNTDTGLATRVLAAACYLLPLLDGSTHGVPFGILVPPAMPFVDTFLSAHERLEHIPFGTLIVFLGLQSLANKTELPALLRFNMFQALQLDVALLLQVILSYVAYNVDGMTNLLFVGIIPFLMHVGYIGYAIASTLCGVAPRSIPYISGWAEQAMGMKPPDIQPKDQDKGVLP